MELLEVELLDNATNNPVIRIPTRKYPGVLVQGDSLSILLDLAKDVRTQLESGDINEASLVAKEMEENLQGRLAMYEEALKSHDIQLPYSKE